MTFEQDMERHYRVLRETKAQANTTIAEEMVEAFKAYGKMMKADGVYTIELASAAVAGSTQVSAYFEKGEFQKFHCPTKDLVHCIVDSQYGMLEKLAAEIRKRKKEKGKGASPIVCKTCGAKLCVITYRLYQTKHLAADPVSGKSDTSYRRRETEASYSNIVCSADALHDPGDYLVAGSGYHVRVCRGKPQGPISQATPEQQSMFEELLKEKPQ